MPRGIYPGRHGPIAKPSREGDKEQARARVNAQVQKGERPHPNTLPCVDCGHEWKEGERRHEYDHHKGYGAAHHYDVEPVCTTCHARRDSPKAQQTKCARGHDFTPANTYRKKNGNRICRTCRREHDRRRSGKRGAQRNG